MDNTYSNEILLFDYTIICKVHSSRGGGVTIAVKNILLCQMIQSPSNLEVVCIKSNLPDSITCCVSYNPPNSSWIIYLILCQI